MCVGSYASRLDNNVEEIVYKFADKVNFVHLRNVRKIQGWDNNVFVKAIIDFLQQSVHKMFPMGFNKEGHSPIVSIQ